MRELSLRFACIFIILMFCLSPLCAVDLNQDDNNNKSINQYKDTNITPNVNETADNKGLDAVNGTEIKDSNSSENNARQTGDVIAVNGTGIKNSTNRTALGLLHDPDLSILVHEMDEGDECFVEIHSDYQLHGNVNVNVDNKYFEDVKMWNGYGSCTFEKSQISPGVHSASVYYFGDDYYFSSLKSSNFKVWGNCNLNISVDDIYLGEKPVAEINANPNFNGIAHIRLNDSDKEYDAEIKNGQGSLTLGDDLLRGSYAATASYEGSDCYHEDEAETSFTVIDKGYNEHFSAHIDDVYVGERPVVEIDPETSLEGEFFVKSPMSLRTYEVPHSNGKIRYRIPEDFKAGNYTTLVGYEDSFLNQSGEVEINFTVNKYDSNLKADVGDIDLEHRPVVEIQANSSCSGKVLISSADFSSEYEGSLINGCLNYTIPEDLKEGNYTIHVAYSGDDRYNSYETEKSFSVLKIDPDLKVSFPHVEYGEVPSIEIRGKKSMNGVVSIRSSDFKNNYYLHVTNGSLDYKFNDEKLAIGNHTVNVEFEGNDTFMSDFVSTNLLIDKIPSNLSVEVEDVDFGQEANFKINANPKFTGTVNLELVNSYNVYPVQVVNGKANKSISDLIGGDQKVKVSFDGDDTYKPSEASANFTVREDRIDPNISAHVEDINLGEKPVIEIHANKSFNGVVVVSSPNNLVPYVLEVKDGYLKYQIPENLKAGNYTLRVSYGGNSTYKQVETTASFEVKDN